MYVKLLFVLEVRAAIQARQAGKANLRVGGGISGENNESRRSVVGSAVLCFYTRISAVRVEQGRSLVVLVMVMVMVSPPYRRNSRALLSPSTALP